MLFNIDPNRLLFPGPVPQKLSPADLERLRASVANVSHAAPESQALINQIVALQQEIADRLNVRSFLLDRTAAVDAEYTKMYEDAKASKFLAGPVDLPSINVWQARATRELVERIESLDAEIITYQSRQRELFNIASRYIPALSP